MSNAVMAAACSDSGPHPTSVDMTLHSCSSQLPTAQGDGPARLLVSSHMLCVFQSCRLVSAACESVGDVFFIGLKNYHCTLFATLSA
jgi:hypothetical protein